MEYDVTIKAVLRNEDTNAEVDVNDLIEAINDEFDNSDINVTIEAMDDDSGDEEVTFAFVVSDTDVKEQPPVAPK